MVRPDPFTALFVVAAIASATGALRTEKRRYWFLCSFFTFSAVTTHLVAMAVLPWALTMLGLAFLLRRLARPDDLFFKRFISQRLVMVVLGAATALLVFLEAIDFRVADFMQLATGVSTSRGGDLASFFTTVTQHFTIMWGYAPQGIVLVVASGVACGIVALGTLPFAQRRHLTLVLTYFVPPALMALFYLLSLGAYPFYHSGYALVGQLVGVWTAVAGFGVLGWLLCERFSILGPIVTIATPILAGIPLLAQASLTSTHGPSFAHDGSSIKFSRYYDEVLANIPSRALVFGGAIFGLESGMRHATLQWVDAMYRLNNMNPETRGADQIPDYLVLNDYLRLLIVQALDPDHAGALTSPLIEYFPGTAFRQKKIVHAMPYGTTIIYERDKNEASTTRPPMVALFDPSSKSWASELEPVATPPVEDRAPARFDLKSFGVVGKAHRTKVVNLPAGAYLFELQPSQRGSGVFMATSTDDFRSIEGVNLNFELFEAPFAPFDSSVFLLARHPGGPLYLSLVNRSGGQTDDFSVKSIWRVADYQVEEASLPLAPVAAWSSAGKTTLAIQTDGSLLVRGDNAAYDPQVRSPKTAVPRNTKLRFKVDLQVIQGNVSVGVQHGSGRWWMHLPQARAIHEFTFDTGDNDHVYFAVANVQPGHDMRSEFVISNPRLTKVESALDRIYRFFGCNPSYQAGGVPAPARGLPPEIYCKTIARP